MPESCFPTDHEGNGTEESKHDQQLPGSWLWPLPCRTGQDRTCIGLGWALDALPTWCGISPCSAHREALLFWVYFIKMILKSVREP